VPFDLIIMPQTHPLVNPGLYRAVLFGTLIAVGITTLALLWLSPAVQVHRATLWCVAGMLAVFAGWSLFGFGYTSAPGPVTLNIASKILALVSALTLFLPPRAPAKTPQPAQVSQSRAYPGGSHAEARNLRRCTLRVLFRHGRPGQAGAAGRYRTIVAIAHLPAMRTRHYHAGARFPASGPRWRAPRQTPAMPPHHSTRGLHRNRDQGRRPGADDPRISRLLSSLLIDK
jgi:hypothetical protein